MQNAHGACGKLDVQCGSPGTLSVSCSRERLLEKNGLRDGLGVDEILIVSSSGPESLRSSNSSNRSSISVGSTSPPTHQQAYLLFIIIVTVNKKTASEKLIITNNLKKKNATWKITNTGYINIKAKPGKVKW